MSLLGIPRPVGRHRGPTIRELQNYVRELQLSRRILKATAHRLAVENGWLERQLDTAGIELSGLRLDLDTARQEGIRLQAALDNATSVSVAAGSRNIWPGEEPTHPIDVSEIRARYGSTNPAAYVPMQLPEAAEKGALQ